MTRSSPTRAGKSAVAARSTAPGAITCGRCGASWSGVSRAHCGGCHRTFSAVSTFDRHRVAVGAHGCCADPATLLDSNGAPLLVLRAGLWSWPEMTAEAKLAAFGGRAS